MISSSKRLLNFIRLLIATKGRVRALNFGSELICAFGVKIYPSKYITLGKRVFLGRGVVLSTSQSGLSPIKIGNDVMFAQDVMLIGGNHAIQASDKPMNELGEGKQGSIVIGNNVWLGARSIVLTGVTIEDGVVVGAGSVVTKSLPANSIAAGNPAKVISLRK
ncbi:acyltransferase [Alteromonadaceae bacterium M269]|nr:acyltransferase [Alteromonadaceae bacterium M269]